MAVLKKNTAGQNLTFCLVNASTGAALTGATVTAKRSVDGAAQASATGSVTELGNGQYNFAASQADTNGDLIGYLFTASSAIPVNVQVRTTAADLSDTVRLGLTALPNAAANADGGLPILSSSGTTLAYTVSTITTYTGNTPQTGDAFARLGAPTGASVSADVAAVKTDTGNLVMRITATLFSGITSLAQWLGLLGGKQTGNSTARTELRATGAGSGTFDETADSQEAIRDRGDAAWTTGGGGSAPTVGEIADAVWDEAAAAHNTSGTMGAKLNAAGAAADPLDNEVPGAYAAGTAGYAMGNLRRVVTVPAPGVIVRDDGSYDLRRGDSYYNANGRSVPFTFPASPSLVGATVVQKIITRDGDFEVEITLAGQGTGTQTGYAEYSSAFTTGLPLETVDYQIDVTLSDDNVYTAARGKITVAD